MLTNPQGLQPVPSGKVGVLVAERDGRVLGHVGQVDKDRLAPSTTAWHVSPVP